MHRRGVGAVKDWRRAFALVEHACERGDAAACGHLALWSAPRGDAKRMVALARRACDGEDAKGCDLLARVTRHGLAGVRADRGEADALAERADRLASAACRAGDADGCARADEPAAAEGRKLAKGSCERGDPLACFELWLSEPLGAEDPAKVSPERVNELEHACRLRVAALCHGAALIHEFHGREETALARYRDACELGDDQGCSGLAQLSHRRGDEAMAADARTQERAHLERRCEAFDSLACGFAAHDAKRAGDGAAVARLDERKLSASRPECELMGRACVMAATVLLEASPPRVAEAITLLETGCRATESCEALAKALIEHGNAAQRGRGMAMLTAWCEAGSADTCISLGELIEPVEPERAREVRTKAVALWATACEKGDAGACFSVGTAYEEGTVVDRDADKGRHYIDRACELGYLLCSMCRVSCTRGRWVHARDVMGTSRRTRND